MIRLTITVAIVGRETTLGIARLRAACRFAALRRQLQRFLLCSRLFSHLFDHRCFLKKDKHTSQAHNNNKLVHKDLMRLEKVFCFCASSSIRVFLHIEPARLVSVHFRSFCYYYYYYYYYYHYYRPIVVEECLDDKLTTVVLISIDDYDRFWRSQKCCHYHCHHHRHRRRRRHHHHFHRR
jgi:hypothetical protein